MVTVVAGRAMKFVHFVFVESSSAQAFLTSEKIDAIKEIVRATPGLRRALFCLPTQAKDYYTDDGASPRLALQLYYDDLEALEEPISATGHLQALTEQSLWSELPGLQITHQAMYVRSYPVPDPIYKLGDDGLSCSILVHYPGEAEDFNSWLNYYLDHHPYWLTRFPGAREFEVYTRLDWRDAIAWQRIHHMQRNRLIFDNPQALEAALNSPARHDSRADFEKFPPYAGGNFHFPMLSEELV